MSRIPTPVGDNLHFLIAEVKSQLDQLAQFFKKRTSVKARALIERKGYSENLMLRIQHACIDAAAEGSVKDIPRLRAIQSIAANLGRIAELARDAVELMEQVESNQVLSSRSHLLMLKYVSSGITHIEEALKNNDSRLALKLGEEEQKTDKHYDMLLGDYTRALKQKKHTEDIISALLVAHTLERMGDHVQDIGEALLSSILGQPIDMDRYSALNQSINRLAGTSKSKKVRVSPVAETRSGSGISAISSGKKRKSTTAMAIYKDGLPRKLKQERDGVANWHDIYPGLAPRILSYQKHGDTASLMIEHLAGMTFEQILIGASDELLHQCMRKLGRKVNDIWKETQQKKIVPAGFMSQIHDRLRDVYAVHPEFESGNSSLCGYRVAAFEKLVKQAEKLEKKLKPPFSVYIHGDFNVDNIIYDAENNRINYVDLHRSRYMDYVQDVSVFMVSNYRLQIMDAPIRKRIIGVINEFYNVARRFAKRNQDDTFELRLALGLVRSLMTSTRFILDKTLAGEMFLKARYLLEQVAALEAKHYSHCRVPVKELFIG